MNPSTYENVKRGFWKSNSEIQLTVVLLEIQSTVFPPGFKLTRLFQNKSFRFQSIKRLNLSIGFKNKIKKLHWIKANISVNVHVVIVYLLEFDKNKDCYISYLLRTFFAIKQGPGFQ